MKRVLLAAAGVVFAAALSLGGPVAHGEGIASSRWEIVEGPWSASMTYQAAGLQPSTNSSSDADSALIIDASDPTKVRLGTEDGLFSFAAPVASGQPLRTGYYGRAVLPGSSDPSRPQMEIESYSFCEERVGRFDVRELHRSSSGSIDRLWINYQLRCASYPGPVDFGEIRIGLSERTYAATPSVVTWPDQASAGIPGSIVDVSIRPTGPPELRVERLTVVGTGRSHFELVSEDCRAASAQAESCTVALRFTPSSPGPHRARLRVDGHYGRLTVPLEGWAIPRETSWRLDFEASHPLGSGYPQTPSQATFGGFDREYAADGSTGLVWLTMNTGDANTAQFWAGDLESGRRYEYNYPDYTPGAPQAWIDLESASCYENHGWFKVHGFDVGAGERLRTARVTFGHVCDEVPGADGQLLGDLRYRWSKDVRRPAAPTALKLRRAVSGRVVGSFNASTDNDLAGTLVRWYPGRVRAATVPTAGLPGQLAGSDTFKLPARTKQVPVTVAVLGYDDSGNMSKPAVARLPWHPR